MSGEKEKTEGSTEAAKETKDKAVDDDLSDEDKQLKTELENAVDHLTESDELLWEAAIETLDTKIRTATSSMTSVPKPLKFLRPHFDTLKELCDEMSKPALKKSLANVISVLGMTSEKEEERYVLKYRLQGNSEPLSSWGHEYVCHLATEIAAERAALVEKEQDVKHLEVLAEEIVRYHMAHNGEPEACDLLMEIERLDLLESMVDEESMSRVSLYLLSCVPYVSEPEDGILLRTTLELFLKFNRFPEAMAAAIRLNDRPTMLQVLGACPEPAMKKQLAYMLGRQLLIFEEVDEDLQEIMRNTHLNESFLELARELDVLEPKAPEDVYKTHLEPSRRGMGASVDSARQNLASTFVNAFVNAGFGTDKLMTVDDDGSKWLYKNKEHGMMSAAASLGMIMQWDVNGGLAVIDKYLYSPDDFVKAGALLACGLVSVGVREECDPAVALLTDHLSSKEPVLKIGAAMGIGLASAGMAREDLIESFTEMLSEPNNSMEVKGLAALSLGVTFVGTGNEEVTSALLETLMMASEAELKESHVRHIAMALGLNFLGGQEKADATLLALQTVPDQPIGLFTRTLVDVCAYAGTGNVLKVQAMTHLCSEHVDVEKTPGGDVHQGIATLGIAMIALAEDVGTEMALRTFNNLLQYGEPVIRRSVPLALALLCASDTNRLSVIDTLSKLTHDSDAEVAHNSILAMGILGAGTNNSRIATMLRSLASFYSKDPANLFMVRLSQGLVYLGKGTISLSPAHTDRSILSPVALAGLIVTLVACLDVKNTILGKQSYFLYFLSLAMNPRLLQTVDEDGNAVAVSVRVGKAVDVVGQAGKPKTITGFQTHTTPVLLAYGERAELASDEYISLNPIMEGFVIVRKNPDAEKKE